MWSKLEETLRCSVCQDIFQQPVFLTCRHSFCNSCLQEWWSQNRRPECPLCRTISPEWDPPLNMPLKSVCEAFLKQKAECQSLRSPDWQEPINPGARPGPVPRFHHVAPHKHFKYELELFGAFKGNYADQVDNIEVQARAAERQIEDVFTELKKMLKREKQARIDAVKEEKKRKLKQLMEILKDERSGGLSERTPQPLDRTFWQGYRKAARKAASCQNLPELPQLLAAGRIEADQHLSNLPCRVLDSMKKQLSSQ